MLDFISCHKSGERLQSAFLSELEPKRLVNPCADAGEKALLHGLLRRLYQDGIDRRRQTLLRAHTRMLTQCQESAARCTRCETGAKPEDRSVVKPRPGVGHNPRGDFTNRNSLALDLFGFRRRKIGCNPS